MVSNWIRNGKLNRFKKENSQHYLALYKSRWTIWMDELFKQYFKEGFNNFMTSMFQVPPEDLRIDIRDHLRVHGVFVLIGDGHVIPAILHQI